MARMTLPNAHDPTVPLGPAAAVSGRSVRELLALLKRDELPAWVELVDDRHHLLFRRADLEDLAGSL